MKPVFFEIGPFPIYAYGFMILLGFLGAIQILAWRFRVKGMNQEHVYDIGLIAMLFGILGARIFYLFQYSHRFEWKIFDVSEGLFWPGALVGAIVFLACYRSALGRYVLLTAASIILGRCVGWIRPPEGSFHPVELAFLVAAGYLSIKNAPLVFDYWKKAHPRVRVWVAAGLLVAALFSMRALHCYRFADRYSWDVFMIWRGGLVFYGGFLFATAAMIYFLKKKKLPVFMVCDMIAPGVALGLAFARIGCFCNGCCFGAFCPHDFPLGVHYPPQSLVGEKNVSALNAEMLYRRYDPQGHRDWLMRPLFSLDIRCQDELNEHRLGEEVCKAFADHDHPLPEEAHVGYVRENRKWLVRDQERTINYIIPMGMPLFRADARHRPELNAGSIPQNLREEFATRRPLTQGAVVKVERPNQNWVIVDGQHQYPVRYDGTIQGEDKLRVYAEALNVYPPIHWGELAYHLPDDVYHAIFKPVYPSQLVASLANFLLFLLLSFLYRFRKNDGEVLLLFGIFYGILRFSLELLRHDTPSVMGTYFTAGQAVSLGMFFICTALFITLRLRPLLKKRQQ